MRIEKLHINDFRRIGAADITFNNDGGMTLLDEETGGRWTLDAIQIAAGAFLRQMPFVSGCTFRPVDGAKARLTAAFSCPLTDGPVEIRREAFTDRNGRLLTTVKDTKPMMELAERCHALRFDPGAVLPLLTFNGARRRWSWQGCIQDDVNWMEVERLVVFADAGTPDAESAVFAQWFTDLWYSMNDQLIKRSRKSILFDPPRLARYGGLLDAVCNTVDACLRPAGIGGLGYDIDARELRVRDNGHWSAIDGMPRDEVAALGAVADLACRCCILNRGQVGGALEATPGIALLDWTEMRAKWLPHVLAAMRAAFPRIQFIIALATGMAAFCRDAGAAKMNDRDNPNQGANQ